MLCSGLDGCTQTGGCYSETLQHAFLTQTWMCSHMPHKDMKLWAKIYMQMCMCDCVSCGIRTPIHMSQRGPNNYTEASGLWNTWRGSASHLFSWIVEFINLALFISEMILRSIPFWISLTLSHSREEVSQCYLNAHKTDLQALVREI